MNDAQIRQLIQSEIMKANQAGKFNLNVTPAHTHTGKGGDAPQINQSDILPGQRVSGNITMAQQTTYTIGTIFRPTTIWFYGNVTDLTDGIRATVVGSAYIGPSYYLQPGTSTSVITGGPQQQIIQSSQYLGVQGTTAHTIAGEGHIIDVGWPDGGTLVARATVTDVGANYIKVTVNNLATNWSIVGNWVIS